MYANPPFTTVDEYIALQPASLQTRLKQLRALILKHAPGVEEGIGYQMPAYKLHGALLYFAAQKNHLGFYAMPDSITYFKDMLKDYVTSKGTIQFPYDKPLPKALIVDIIRFRVAQNLDKQDRVAARKKSSPAKTIPKSPRKKASR